MSIYQLGELAPSIAESAFVASEATIIGRAELAGDVSVWPGAVIRADNEAIWIGAGSNVQEGAVLHTDPGCPLQIGERVSVGHQAMLHGCTVGDGALVGIQANLTALYDAVSELEEGQPVADALVDHWVDMFRQQPPHEEYRSDVLLNVLGGRVHPRIRAALDAAKATTHANLTVVDAVRAIIDKSGWGHTEVAVMTRATVQDFELALKTLEGNGFMHFVCRCVDMYMHRTMYDTHFGTALSHFIEACRNICADPSQKRLSRTLRMLFDDAKLPAALAPVVPADSQAP